MRKVRSVCRDVHSAPIGKHGELTAYALQRFQQPNRVSEYAAIAFGCQPCQMQGHTKQREWVEGVGSSHTGVKRHSRWRSQQGCEQTALVRIEHDQGRPSAGSRSSRKRRAVGQR